MQSERSLPLLHKNFESTLGSHCLPSLAQATTGLKYANRVYTFRMITSNNHTQFIESYPIGVFDFLINQAAFVDKAVFNLWGVRRCRPRASVCIERNLPIAGRGRMYARSVHGYCCVTQNPFELKYGRLRKYKALAPFRLILRSEMAPVTGAQVSLVSDSLFRKGLRSYVSAIEMTLDLDTVQIASLVSGIWTTARTRTEFEDESGRRSLYLGTPHSTWQLRLYQKSHRVVRFEYVFRLPFLQAIRISQPQDLVRLRKIRLGKLVRYAAPTVQGALRKMGRRVIW
jgi:hypothetical protein